MFFFEWLELFIELLALLLGFRLALLHHLARFTFLVKA
jgi:hypothetical protein